jgi:DNA-binding NtrC family response regulator
MATEIEHPGGPARLLVIDRDAVAAKAAAEHVGACFPGSPEAQEVASGRQAAELLRSESFDIVFADLQSLFDLSPITEDAVAKLAKLAAGALTIAISDGGSVSAAVAAMRAGAHDVLAKPIGSPALAARLAELSQRHGKALDFGPAGGAERGAPTLLLAANRDSNGATEYTPFGQMRRPPVLPMWQQEQRIIEDAIASFSGNIALAAAALQLSPSTIYRKRQAWADAETGNQGAA